MAKAVNLNMTQGPLLGKVIRFSVPLMLSGMLQLLYNAADVVVVGRFAAFFGEQTNLIIGQVSLMGRHGAGVGVAGYKGPFGGFGYVIETAIGKMGYIDDHTQLIHVFHGFKSKGRETLLHFDGIRRVRVTKAVSSIPGEGNQAISKIIVFF